jgi:hypothetical protein
VCMCVSHMDSTWRGLAVRCGHHQVRLCACDRVIESFRVEVRVRGGTRKEKGGGRSNIKIHLGYVLSVPR